MTRYDRWSNHKKHRYLWQINNILNIRSQILNLTSIASKEGNYQQNFFLQTLHYMLEWIYSSGFSAYCTYIYHMYLYFSCLDRLSYRIKDLESRCSIKGYMVHEYLPSLFLCIKKVLKRSRKVKTLTYICMHYTESIMTHALYKLIDCDITYKTSSHF